MCTVTTLGIGRFLPVVCIQIFLCPFFCLFFCLYYGQDCGGDGPTMDGQSEYELAKFYEQHLDMTRAQEHVRAAAHKGLITAMLHMGHVVHGESTRNTGDETAGAGAAVPWFEQAARLGSTDALVLLGELYHDGSATPTSEPDPVTAALYYTMALAPSQRRNDAVLARAGIRTQFLATALFAMGMMHR